MIRQSAKILVMFLICFVIFITSSYMIYHTTTELSSAAIQQDVHVETNSIFTNIATVFQMIWGIITLGLGVAFILSILTGRGQQEIPYDRFGGNRYLD